MGGGGGGEGIIGLGAGVGEAEGNYDVDHGGEGIQCEGPSALLGQLEASWWRRGLLVGPATSCARARDAFLDQDVARGVEMDLAADPAFELAGAHGALLEQGGRGVFFQDSNPEGGKGAQRVVAHARDGLGEVELCGRSLEVENASMNLAADLQHVGRVREGTKELSMMVLPSLFAHP